MTTKPKTNTEIAEVLEAESGAKQPTDEDEGDSGEDEEEVEEEEEEEDQIESDEEEENGDDEEVDGDDDEAAEDEGQVEGESESEGGGEEEEEEEGDDDDEIEAVGFGDAMNKILQQNVAEDAQPILAKRTTARMRAIQSEKKETKTAKLSAAERKQREQKDMVIPDHTTMVEDRRLRMIATKGVVALFNAIEKHQFQNAKKAVQVEKAKAEKQVKEMSKENFLGLLKASSQPSSSASAKASFLQDDYMMDPKMRSYDQDTTSSSKPHKKARPNELQNPLDDVEAVEDTAWKQVATMDSDNDDHEDSEPPQMTMDQEPTPQRAPSKKRSIAKKPKSSNKRLRATR